MPYPGGPPGNYYHAGMMPPPRGAPGGYPPQAMGHPPGNPYMHPMYAGGGGVVLPVCIIKCLPT